MTLEEARQLVILLADGVDPRTGEVLPEDHLLHHRDCVRALSIIVSAAGEGASARGPSKSKPTNAGLPWTQSDDERLKQVFSSGKSVSEISRDFERTVGAINSRLERLGIIQR